MSFPLLHRVLAAIVSFSLFKETLGIGVVGLLSLSDWSWGILPSLSISLGDERTLQIWLPRFFGNRTAELGQFAGLDMFMTALRLRF
jgi:hypothetical protein